MAPEHQSHILVVDDSPDTLEVLQRNLAARGYQVSTAPGVSDAVKLLAAKTVDVVITDLKMPGISGLDLVRHVHENYRDTEVLMITGYPSVEGAVQAVKSGAQDFLAKPFTDEELFRAIDGAFTKLNARRAAKGGGEIGAPVGLEGQSPVMRRAFKAIEQAVASQAPVLLYGESGTGKERFARAIHYSGVRACAPFVPANLSGVPHERQEEELFGNAKHHGLFQAAHGGTLFLRGIAEADQALQARLAQTIRTMREVRVIAAANQEPLVLVRRGALREDLYYALSVVTIEVPSLRERENDILLLAHEFARQFATEAGRPTPQFSDEAIEVLRSYDWPGNVRELQNVVQRLIVVGGSVLDVPDLPTMMRFAPKDSYSCRTLDDVEREHIRKVLETVDGNRTKAAQILGIDRKTLREKMKRA